MSLVVIRLLISIYITISLAIFLVMNFCVSGNIEHKKSGEIIEVGTPKYILIIAGISIFWPIMMIVTLIERRFK